MGKVLKIIGIIILALVVFIFVVGFYFYNYYVFKTVRICVGEGINSEVSCDSAQNCIDLIGEIGLNVNLGSVPDFIEDSFQKVIDEAIYCNLTCFVKNIRGVNFETQKLEMLENCREGEIEFVVEIHGKDGIEIWKYLKNRDSGT